MSDITVPPPTEPTVTIVPEPADCPFPDERLTMRFGFGGMPLTQDEAARSLLARRHRSIRLLDRLTVVCSPAPVVLPDGMSAAYAIRARCHTEQLFDDHRVHIEAIAQELGGPGGTNAEIRVYVDGMLEGRSIRLGRLGATVNTFPLVATIGPDAVLSVMPVRWTSLETLNVELWRAEARR